MRLFAQLAIEPYSVTNLASAAYSNSSVMLHKFSGAFVRRTIDRSSAQVPEHSHDWPLLSLFVIGAYSNQTDLGEKLICGPSAVFYAAGAAHRNTAGPQGFEQIEIEFDPAWLRGVNLPEGPVSRWIGGQHGAAARSLARLCNEKVGEKLLLSSLSQFFEASRFASPERCPDWLNETTQRLGNNPSQKISALARSARLHPSWLGTAYKRATGEGLTSAAARFRVERAARLLRESDLPFAQVAADSGFCDQSHMIRTFHRILGRRPSAIREDKDHFRQT